MKTKSFILILILAGFFSHIVSEVDSRLASQASKRPMMPYFAETLFDDVFASLEIASGIAESELKSSARLTAVPLLQSLPGCRSSGPATL